MGREERNTSWLRMYTCSLARLRHHSYRSGVNESHLCLSIVGKGCTFPERQASHGRTKANAKKMVKTFLIHHVRFIDAQFVGAWPVVSPIPAFTKKDKTTLPETAKGRGFFCVYFF